VARAVGTLSLALRSITDNAAELDEAIASGAVRMPRNADARTEAAILRNLSNRPNDRRTGAATGGDVSRYLRGSMPTRRTPRPDIQATNDMPRLPPSQSPRGGALVEAPGILGPSVRVVRGDQVTIVPIEGR
jgi:pilus assembly protein CpaB